MAEEPNVEVRVSYRKVGDLSEPQQPGVVVLQVKHGQTWRTYNFVPGDAAQLGHRLIAVAGHASMTYVPCELDKSESHEPVKEDTEDHPEARAHDGADDGEG